MAAPRPPKAAQIKLPLVAWSGGSLVAYGSSTKDYTIQFHDDKSKEPWRLPNFKPMKVAFAKIPRARQKVKNEHACSWKFWKPLWKLLSFWK